MDNWADTPFPGSYSFNPQSFSLSSLYIIQCIKCKILLKFVPFSVKRYGSGALQALRRVDTEKQIDCCKCLSNLLKKTFCCCFVSERNFQK